jgi:deoxyribonuclease V
VEDLILAVDVHYRAESATAAGAIFSSWESDRPEKEVVVALGPAQAYSPGRFYLRELPCLLHLLARIRQPLFCIVIDGYVFLGREQRPGLGMHLWVALGGRIPVIGVAKSRFRGTPSEAVLFRGASRRPLYVTSVGIAPDEAKACIHRMAGKHRIPTLLQRVDHLSRTAEPAR